MTLSGQVAQLEEAHQSLLVLTGSILVTCKINRPLFKVEGDAALMLDDLLASWCRELDQLELISRIPELTNEAQNG